MHLVKRHLVPMAVAAGLAAVALLWTSVATNRSDARRRTVEDLSRHAALLAASAHLLSPENLQAYAIRTSTTLGARVTLIARDGTVVADSAIGTPDLPGMDNHLGRPEIEAALERGSGVSLRRSSTTRVRYWYIAHRVDAPAAVGFVRLAAPTSYLPSPPWYSRWPVLLTALLSMLTLIGIAALVARRTSHALDRLTATLDGGGAEPAGAAPPQAVSSIERLSNAMRRDRDATQHKIAALNAKGAILASVISGMKEGLLVVGDDRRIHLANRALQDILELPFEPTGRRVAEVVRHPSVMQDLETALAERREIHESIITFETSGRSFELQITPIIHADDASIHLLVLFFDVTRLEALDAVRREFVGNVSHELRTPLTSIRAFVENLLDGDLGDREATRRFLDIVRKHSERMNALLDDLTDLSAIETGSVRLVPREVDAEALVREVIEQLKPFAEARQVEVTADFPEPLKLFADRGRLEQVFTNLLHNAIKFNRPQGTVQVRGSRGGGRVRLSVKDSGPGIPAGSHDKIFNRFYQLDKARSREHGGTGLGLAIVKHLVRLHEGTVSVDSELGHGATFTLEFPERGSSKQP